jgi:large subunit ribosomal protein L31
VRKGIHSEYLEARVECGSRNPFATRSTPAKINTAMCSACHALYTSKQKHIDTLGRIEKFQREYSKDYVIKEKQGKY